MTLDQHNESMLSNILFCAHQSKERKDGAFENKNNAIFDHVSLRKYYVEIDSLRYPRYSLLIIYEENNHIEQHRKFKIIFQRTCR